ncbi:MAG: restriction endonuclease-like protein [Candidatus Obscuribacterales bacterium]|nr:restriction endonuclease-like protein [Candidatus Obscuribacterales bacterium]
MNKLFHIETENVELTWRTPERKEHKLVLGIGEQSGHLKITLRTKAGRLISVWRAGVPETIAYDADLTVGPQLHEQTDYKIFVRSKSDKRISLHHADPNISNSLVSEDAGKLVFGSINFRSEVGFSQFTVNVEGEPEFDFVIEVFPTKLDYKSDYEQLVAETQDYIAGLVFEYLRSTYRLSLPVLEKQSSTLEWLLLLQMVVKDLERAANFVAHHPVRGLVRDPQSTKAEKIKRLDPHVRRAVQRGAGSGAMVEIDDLQVRQYLPNRRTTFTLDTPEHRWISTQLKRIREKLVSIRLHELDREGSQRREKLSPRKQKLVSELTSLEQRILQIQQLEPFKENQESPPPGFASLQLLSSPGYRECYRACNMLSLGLQIEGGPLNLSLKEISTLYEYWCFLTLIYLLSEQTGEPIPVEKLVKAKHSGLEILLKTGKESTIVFKQKSGRRIKVMYNKPIHGDLILVPQRPDILITLDGPNWPTLSLLLDAKYRVRFDEDYIKQYGAPGPDIDAVNVLHRYRDAILESKGDSIDGRPKRTIIQASAIFPFRDSSESSFRNSKLWQSIDKLGIGAIPLLPGNKDYFKEWLLTVLEHGGWSIADQAIAHAATERAQDWRVAASEAVLIGVLKPEISEQHLNWIIDNRYYYMPLFKSHPRQLAVKFVAIYSPSPLRKPGAVTHLARVTDIDVQPRDKIDTPWNASRESTELCVVYELEPLETLVRPIENRMNDGKGRRFSQSRWTTRLALERATVLSELFLESEPEWRLFEELQEANVPFCLEPGQPQSLSLEDPNWRTWFVFEHDIKARYAGLHGFLLKNSLGEQSFVATIGDVVSILAAQN